MQYNQPETQAPLFEASKKHFNSEFNDVLSVDSVENGRWGRGGAEVVPRGAGGHGTEQQGREN